MNIKSPTRPLANIKHSSVLPEEEQILFRFGPIFRLDDLLWNEHN